MLPTGLWITTLMTSLAGFVVLGVERGERVRFDAALLSLVVRESTARSLFWLLRPLGHILDPSPGGPTEHPPVLLVAGSSINRSAFLFLRTFLRHRGFRVGVVDPVQHQVGIAAAAEALRPAVERLLRGTPHETLDLVGYGSGGLVAAWYARHVEPSQVRRLVTLGTPWRGTKLSVFRRGRLGDDTRYGSPLLDDLVPAIPTVSIWSPDDPTVIPSSSATPDGLQPVEIEGAGHADLLVSARAFRAIQAALR